MINIWAYLPSMGTIFFIFVACVIAVAAFLWFFIFRSNTNMICDMFEEREGGDIVLLLSNFKIAVIKKKDQVDKWKILKTNIEPFEPKHKDNLIPYLSAKTDKIYLLRDKHGFIHVMKMSLDGAGKVKMMPDYRDPLNFIVTDYDERAKVKEASSAWKEYQPMIVSIICLAMVVVTIIFTFKYAVQQTTSITSAISAGKDEIHAYAAQYSETILRAKQIVLNQQVLDQTANWTTTSIGG